MPPLRSWIELVPYAESEGRLRELYDRVRGPSGAIDTIMRVHGLRPHTMEGHLALYKSVLHHARNALPRWLLETAGVYVSLLNGCAYCVEHHTAGLRRLLRDDARTDAIRAALGRGAPEAVFEGRELAVLRYAEALTRDPAGLTPASLDAMRAAGMDDGEILEVNQVVAYFAYANRTVLGLGVTTEGDELGQSPSATDRPDDWSHR
ncbi:MAG: peroxidase-related enzyme [Trueperaceae bacterium]|nr:peroxidase-related enzyme [Trueperaceae bacterium]